MEEEIRFYVLPWAVVGVKDGHFTAESLRRCGDRSVEEAVERYVLLYMGFWHISFRDREEFVPCHDAALQQQAREKITAYVRENPPTRPLPKFYLVLVGQRQFTECGNGISEVYCL